MNFEKRSILFVSDTPASIEGISEILKPDFELLYATKGQQGFEIARTQKPDLIILDDMLPDIHSEEICSRLRADSRTHTTPVIFMSHSDDKTIMESLNAGSVDFIMLPVHPAVFIARVRLWLELKHYRDLFEDQVTSDRLTGIPGRKQFDEVLKREWQRAMRFQTPQSLIVVDIDFFGAYIDSYGRLAGDDCLRKIARELGKAAQRETDFVARYGDDVFAFLLPETDAGGALNVAQQIQEAVDRLNIPHTRSPIADHITLSISVVTMMPTPTLNADQLFQQATTLLSEAKRDGHNQIKYWQIWKIT